MNIYFAHACFTEEQKNFKKIFAEGFTKLMKNDHDIRVSGFHEVSTPKTNGIHMLDPFVYSPAVEGDREAKKMLGRPILKVNKDMMNISDMVIGCIDDRDQGVIWELGYANAKTIPTITISSKDYDLNIMMDGSVLCHVPDVLNVVQMHNLTNIVAANFKLAQLDMD